MASVEIGFGSQPDHEQVTGGLIDAIDAWCAERWRVLATHTSENAGEPQA